MNLSGFVLLDKIPGETSFKALFPLKRVFSTKRVGHAGTLDLRASGLIIAAVGRATRLLPYVEAQEKCYTFRLHLGYETDTLEWDGEVLVQDEKLNETYDSLQKKLEDLLPHFTGEIDQVPPKYCAVKIDGRRASDLMERGRTVELKPRKIKIHSLKILAKGEKTEGTSGIDYFTFDMECVCSKGTYIRSLGRDLARALGTHGSVSKIKRHRIGDVTLDLAVKGEYLTQEHLIPADKVLKFPVVKLSTRDLTTLRLGNFIPWKTMVEGLDNEGNLFAADEDGHILCFCFYEPGRIRPKFYLGPDN